MNFREYSHLIDGAEASPASGSWIYRESPATGARVSQFANGTKEDCNKAIRAARKGFQNHC